MKTEISPTVNTPIKRLFLGPIIYLLAMAAYKAYTLTDSMMADWSAFLVLWCTDFLYIAAATAVAIGAAQIGRRWARWLAGGILLLLTSYYLLDTATVLALDSHASFFDIARYSVEWRVVLSFIDARTYLAGILLVTALIIQIPYSRTSHRIGLAALLVFSIAGSLTLSYAPTTLARYAVFNPANLLAHVDHPLAAEQYTNRQIALFNRQEKRETFIPESRPDIILVIVESLSAVNSKKVSGLNNLLGHFDDMAADGMLFTNFFANHQASEGGIISLLSGFPPMHFPTATPYMFDEFASMPSVLGRYRERGYYTEFLTNAELQFIGLNHYLTGMGVDRSRGRDEVSTMRKAERVVQDAPPDTLLYSEALSTVDFLHRVHPPYLLVLATTSTHLPYTHPAGGPDTPAAVWDWSLRQLQTFYQNLKTKGFFDHGILLITGDHRQMRPLTRAETERYGDSAKARVPLLIIGPGYSPGTVDTRFFQQSDLLRDLGKIPSSNAPLSPWPTWVERYNRKYGHIELINTLGIFDQADQGRREYRLTMPGNRIEWLDETPPFAPAIESRINAQRSLHQQLRSAVVAP